MGKWNWTKTFLAEGLESYEEKIDADQRAVALKTKGGYSGWVWVPKPVLLVGPCGPCKTLAQLEAALTKAVMDSWKDEYDANR